MSYFLARYLYRKYKNRNQASETDELNEHQEQQQVPTFADQPTTESGADGVKGHAAPLEKDPSAEYRQVPDKKRSQNLKSVPLCEHQLATVNGTNPLNGEAALHEKAPEPHYRHIPDEKRGPKNCPECITDKKRDKKYRWKLILSLLIPNMMASMDLTITASALPIIASHFSMFYINQKLIANCSHRQAKPVQLDCQRIYLSIHLLSPLLRSNIRCFRAPYRNTGRYTLRAHW
jgi:hypothetical protein